MNMSGNECEMCKGEPFQPSDKSHFFEMLKAEFLLWHFNKSPLWRIGKRNRIIRKLFGSIDGNPYNIQSPFHCVYGKNIHAGKNLYTNYNCVIMDLADVYIGDNVFIAPNVTITTITHPMKWRERIVKPMENTFEPEGRGNIEYINPVRIGNNVWLASGVIVCPGVEIGENSVIGAGSVVTRNIPANVFACGVPCKVINKIDEEQ